RRGLEGNLHRHGKVFLVVVSGPLVDADADHGRCPDRDRTTCKLEVHTDVYREVHRAEVTELEGADAGELDAVVPQQGELGAEVDVVVREGITLAVVAPASLAAKAKAAAPRNRSADASVADEDLELIRHAIGEHERNPHGLEHGALREVENDGQRHLERASTGSEGGRDIVAADGSNSNRGGVRRGDDRGSRSRCSGRVANRSGGRFVLRAGGAGDGEQSQCNQKTNFTHLSSLVTFKYPCVGGIVADALP